MLLSCESTFTGDILTSYSEGSEIVSSAAGAGSMILGIA